MDFNLKAANFDFKVSYETDRLGGRSARARFQTGAGAARSAVRKAGGRRLSEPILLRHRWTDAARAPQRRVSARASFPLNCSAPFDVRALRFYFKV